MIRLSATVNSAYRGYSWSRLPEGTDEAGLDKLLGIAAEVRGDYPEPGRIDRGIVLAGGLAAAFSVQTALNWDSEGRDSEYAAFALFDPAEAAAVDFGELLKLPFFSHPSRDAAGGTLSEIEYTGGPSAPSPLTAAGSLVCRQRCENLPASAAGHLLATYHFRSPYWLFRLMPGPAPLLTVTCLPWRK